MPNEKEKIELGEYEVLEDMMLDGLKIVQDTRLYRFTSDSVLLSRFAKAKKRDVVADFCAGSGIVAFHFYALNRAKLQDLKFTLFELQKELSDLSKKTAQINGFDCFSFEQGRLQDIPKKYNGQLRTEKTAPSRPTDIQAVLKASGYRLATER